MSFDVSRYPFDPRNDFSGVVMQQGRVQLDSDWNEWLAELGRRIQAGTLDLLGRAVVPITTKDAFKITLGHDSPGNASLEIGPGRMYVDGLLAENHGLPAPAKRSWIPASDGAASDLAAGRGVISAGVGEPTVKLGHLLISTPRWDPALDELVGPLSVPYPGQPYFPTADTLAPFPRSGGPFLVYLDVWQREVTFLEDPDLIEKAVGVDTTGRLQTVWQVKWLDVSNVPGVTCSTKDEDLPPWHELLRPPGARLTTGVVQSSPSGPCCLTSNTGYTGLENQLYRVVIHQPGTSVPSSSGAPVTAAPAGTATFTWSRDNASVATPVTGISADRTVLTVVSTGKDDVLRFSPRDWVELRDDWLELSGLPGALHQVADVDDARKTITLASAVSATSFPVDANGQTSASRHTRLTRWDQSGKVYEGDGATVWVDLDAAGSTGDIPIPPPGVSLILESGITVTFGHLSNGAPFTTGDDWTFAARSEDGTVELLDRVPPRGTYHHYARLAIVRLTSVPLTASGTVTLSDQSVPPVGFLSFQATPPAQWPARFGILTRANPDNAAHFDLAVVYNPAAGAGVTGPVTVESFSDLSVIPSDPNFAATVINGGSKLIQIPGSYQPPAQTLTFAPSFAAQPTPLTNTGTISLSDNGAPPVPFLTLQAAAPATWPGNFIVSASPSGGGGNFALDVVYAPVEGGAFATVERFDDLSLASVATKVTSAFITKLAVPLSLPYPTLNLVTLADCRSFWPPASGQGCDCGCGVVVQPSDLTGTNPLQALIDQYQNLSTPTVICLGAGTYALPSPLRFGSAHANLTLRACSEGQVELQAAPGAESQFADGLVVLDNVNNVTLRGLRFTLPRVRFQPANGEFAGVPVTSLAPGVQQVVNNLVVSIGIRLITGSSLTIDACQFDFGSPNRDRLIEREGNPIPFGIGIFAGGQCAGLRVTKNQFVGEADFAAGFVLVPAVTFNRPRQRRSIGIDAAPADAAAQATPASPTTATSNQTGLRSDLLRPIVPILQAGTTPASLAAAGGQVVPASLDQAVFTGNTLSGLTIASLILGETGSIQFADNSVDHGGDGIWLVTPSWFQLLSSLPGSPAIAVGSAVALGYPLPSADAGIGGTIAAAPAPTRVFTGAAAVTDSLGQVWTPDSSSRAVTVSGGNLNQPAHPAAIANTPDSTLYQAERWGNFTYTFDQLPAGFYRVTLKFAEIVWSAANLRVFDVRINGDPVLTNFDVFQTTGGANRAVDQTFDDVVPVDGKITIQFQGTTLGRDSNAKVSAIEVIPQWSSLIAGSTEIQTFVAEEGALAAQGYVNGTVTPLQARIEENNLQRLRSFALLILNDDQARSQKNQKVSSLMLSGNQMASRSVNERLRLFWTGAVAEVTRCVITGNLVLNDSTNREGRVSFVLDDSGIPIPELAIMSNVFQGRIQIAPPRYEPNDPAAPPFPMNTWEFLNTVIP